MNDEVGERFTSRAARSSLAARSSPIFLLTALGCALGLLLFAWHVVAFMRVTPGHDFVGDVLYADRLAESLRHGQFFPDWIADEAFGRPSTVQRSSLLLFVPVALLELAGMSSLLAAKLWMVALHLGSLASFASLARVFGVGRWASLGAALAFGLSRLHLQSFVVSGHWQLAVSFFLAPLLLRSVVLIVRRSSELRAARASIGAFALLFGWAVLADNERTVTLLPVLALGAALEARHLEGGRAWIRAAACVGGAFLLGGLISAGGSLPLLLESRQLALTREASLFPAHDAVKFSHPLFVLDGGSLLYSPSLPRPVGAGGVSESFALLAGAALAIAVAGRAACSDVEALRSSPLARCARGFGLVMAIVLWLGTARPSWLVSSFSLYPSSPAASVCAGGLFLGGMALLVVLTLRGAAMRTKLAATLGIAVLVLIPSQPILAKLPVFSAIANVRWFLQVNLPLVSALLFGFVLDGALVMNVQDARSPANASLRRLVVPAMALVLLALAGLDALTTPRRQTILDPAFERDARAAGEALDRDPSPGRYLRFPYVESDAGDAFLQRFTRRSSAGSWLMWAASRSGAAAYVQIRNGLEEASSRPVGESAVMALLEASQDDIRFFVVPSTEHRLDPWLRAGLLELVHDGGLRILRNTLHGSSLGSWATLEGEPVPFTRTTAERFFLSLPPGSGARRRVRITEAYYPYWHATFESGATRTEVPIESASRTTEGFLTVRLGELAAKSGGTLEFRYERPWTDGFALSLSVLFGLVALSFLHNRRPALDSP